MIHSHDLFLLLLNLSQYSDRNLVIRLFTEAMTATWEGLSFSFAEALPPPGSSSLEVRTMHMEFGYLMAHGSDDALQQLHHPLLTNSVLMLALLLERLAQHELLENRKKLLELEVAERNQDLLTKTRQLELAMEGGRTTFWEWNIRDGGISCGAQVSSILGYGTDGGIDRLEFWLERLHPEDRDRVAQAIRAHLEGDADMFREEFRLLNNVGNWIWIGGQGSVTIRDSRGTPLIFTGILADISFRKNIEERLKQSERRWKSILTKLPQIGVSLSPEGEILFVNDFFVSFSGWRSEEILGKNWFSIFVPEEVRADLWQVLRAYMNLDDGAGSFHLENEIVLKNGERRLVSWANVVNRSPDGRVTDIASLGIDLTERLRSEEQLKKSAERLRQVVAKMPHPLCISNSRTKDLVYVNETFINTFGYMVEDIPTIEDWWEVAYPDSAYREEVRSVWDKAVERSLRLGEIVSPQIWRVRCKNGTYRDVEFSLMPLDNITLTSMTDLTSHRELQAGLLAAKNEAVAASRAKSEFLANMSHEIRTPLNGIMGMLQCIQLSPNDPGVPEYAAIAMNSCRRLTKLLSDILDISRVEAGKMVLQEQVLDLRESLARVEELTSGNAREKGLELSFFANHDIPELLIGDASRIEQVLLNLVSNAIKFTDKGRIEVTVSPLTSRDSHECRVLFQVADTGIGIDDSVVKTIFESFTQADGSNTRRFQGAGLGLNIVKRLVDLMGGTISVESEVNVGTTVYWAQSLKPAMGRPVAEIEPTPRMHYFMSRRVLLVEDDPVSSYVLTLILGKLGMSVRSAENAETALEMLQQSDFDLVFMDVQLPGMDGLEAVRAIRSDARFESNSDISVIALTAYALAGDRERILDAGLDGYLAKPVEMDVLIKELRRVFDGK